MDKPDPQAERSMCRLLLVTIACLAILFGISGLYMMPKMIQTKIEEVSPFAHLFFLTNKPSACVARHGLI